MSMCDQSYSCPPSIIATAALAYLELGVEFETAGYEKSVLEHIKWITGYYDKQVAVSFRQASELAAIGRSLLDVHERQPELRRVTTNMFGTQDEWEILDHNKIVSIQWLLQVVEQVR